MSLLLPAALLAAAQNRHTARLGLTATVDPIVVYCWSNWWSSSFFSSSFCRVRRLTIIIVLLHDVVVVANGSKSISSLRFCWCHSTQLFGSVRLSDDCNCWWNCKCSSSSCIVCCFNNCRRRRRHRQPNNKKGWDEMIRAITAATNNSIPVAHLLWRVY